MSRIETKLSPTVGGEFVLQSNPSGLANPLRASAAVNATVQETHLVGADNTVKGVLRELAGSAGLDGRRFVFYAANVHRETPLPARVSTLDDAKAFVRRHFEDGHWKQPGQTSGMRGVGLTESQLFGSNGKAVATQGSVADNAGKRADSAFVPAEPNAARAQPFPSLIRTAGEAQRHVRLETSQAEQRDPGRSETTTNADARSGNVGPVQAEPMPDQDAVKVATASFRSTRKLRKLRPEQQRKHGELTLILSARGELLDAPFADSDHGNGRADAIANTTTAAQSRKQRANAALGAWMTLLSTAILIMLLGAGFYMWGPRPAAGPAHSAAFAATALPGATAAMPSIGLEKPDLALRSQPFEAQKHTAPANSGKGKRKGANPCGAGTGAGDVDTACPSAAQDSRSEKREAGIPPSASISNVADVANVANVANVKRPDEPSARETQSEGAGSR